MAVYRFSDLLVSSPESPKWAEILAEARKKKILPACQCQMSSTGKGVAMYITTIAGGHALRRMPFTGSQHADHCEHHELAPELSGFGQVSGSAIREDPEDGTTTLRLDFALRKGRSRASPAGGDTEHESVRADGTKLTLRATLHYLLDEAGLTRWRPRMKGRRSWGVVRREIQAAAFSKRTKGSPLSEALFLPEPFAYERAAEIQARRSQKLAPLADPNTLMLFIAPVKALEPARFGHRMVLFHMPDAPLRVADDLYKRLTKRFASQLALWSNHDEDSHLLLIGTVTQSMPGVLELDSACLVNVNIGWLPFDGAHEFELLEQLHDRHFTKGQRYNLPSTTPLAAAVLHDTDEPTALYILPPDASDGFRKAAEDLIDSSGVAAWWWECQGPLPSLPPRKGEATPQPSPVMHPQEAPLTQEEERAALQQYEQEAEHGKPLQDA